MRFSPIAGRKLGGLFGLGVVMLFVAACQGPDNILTSPGVLPSFAADGIAEEGEFEVCKTYVGAVGPAVVIDWTVDFIAPNAASTSGSTSPLGDGECEIVHNYVQAGSNNGLQVQRVTVTEQTPSGYTPSHIVTPADLLGPGTPGPETAGNSASGDMTSNPDNGFLVLFINTEISRGCTLTQGYWKTHNATFPGGAPVDPTWALVGALAEGETFFLSGQTWFEVFWTAPAGNAYYNLAHQYMAAALNVLAGADPTAVSSELASAAALFAIWTPAEIGALRGNNSLRKEFLSLASALDDYNQGIIGPGHCDSPVD